MTSFEEKRSRNRREFLKQSGKLAVAAGLADVWGSERARAEVFDPTPDDGFKQNHYGFIIKRTPEAMDPQEVDRVGKSAHWRSGGSDPYPIIMDSSRPGSARWSTAFWLDVKGPERTPESNVAGVSEISFEGALRMELRKRAGTKTKIHDRLRLETGSRTWKLDGDTGEMMIPKKGDLTRTAATEEGVGKASSVVALGDVGLIGAVGPVLFRPTVGFTFYWEVYVRKTQFHHHPNGSVTHKILEERLVSRDFEQLGLRKLKL